MAEVKPCVALFVYERTDFRFLSKLLNQVDSWSPSKIFIFSDGPKLDGKESEKILQLRAFIDSFNFLSPFEIIRHSSNVGLRSSIEFGAQKVFSEFNSCIFIEDDIELFDDTWEYFSYCLRRFEKDPLVGHISGWNLNDSKIQNQNYDLYLDIFPASFVWATWKDRWVFYSSDTIDVTGFRVLYMFVNRLRSIRGAFIWMLNARAVKKSYLDSWAINWTLSLWKNNFYAIAPRSSLSCLRTTNSGSHNIAISFKDSNKKSDFPSNPKYLNQVIHRITKLKLKRIYKSYFSVIILRYLLDKHRFKVKAIKQLLWVGRDSNPEPTD